MNDQIMFYRHVQRDHVALMINIIRKFINAKDLHNKMPQHWKNLKSRI